MAERDVFLEAIEIQDPIERQRFLEERFADDEPARQRVLELLQAADKVGDFLEVPAAEATAAYRDSQEPDLTGSLIAGKYKLRQKLGEGGVGSVWVRDRRGT